MSNPFLSYGSKATSNAPDRLIGPIKRRADARLRYGEIVCEMAGQTHPEDLEIYLISIERELTQFRAELPFLWSGEGAEQADFLGLQNEIALAQARVDDGLDFPRFEPSSPNLEQGFEA